MKRQFADAILDFHEWIARKAVIGPDSRRGARFGTFGPGSAICFPPQVLFNEQAIHIGNGVIVGPNCSLTVGMAPGQELIAEEMLVIGDRCLIGRGCSIAAHFHIEIGADVFFGPNVFVTDQNHGNSLEGVPIGHQTQPESPISIGARSWLATGVVVTPGVTIGTDVMIGANSVVTRDIPDGSVAAGAPARVID